MLAEVPDDVGRRGVLADWLEEKGVHHDQATVDLLRTHAGPLFLTRHPKTKKAVAVEGTPHTEVSLNDLREAHGLEPIHQVFGTPTDIIHGPRGVVVVARRHSLDTGRESHAASLIWGHSGRFRHGLTDHGSTGFPSRQHARSIAQEHAFGE